MQEKSLESRIDRLESIEAVRNLMYKWAHYIDMAQWEMVVDLYADDAVSELSIDRFPKGGIFRGKEEIVIFYRNFLGSQAEHWAGHHVISPVVEIEGDWAYYTAYNLVMTMFGEPDSGSAYWWHGRLDNVCQRVGGKWLIKRERIVFNIAGSPYDSGWHKEGFVGAMKPGQPQHPRPVSNSNNK